MQNTLTHQLPPENDCFAEDTAEGIEQIDTPLSSVSIRGRRYVTCGLMTTSICWEAAKKNSNNSLKDWRKQSLDTV